MEINLLNLYRIHLRFMSNYRNLIQQISTLKGLESVADVAIFNSMCIHHLSSDVQMIARSLKRRSFSFVNV